MHVVDVRRMHEANTVLMAHKYWVLPYKINLPGICALLLYNVLKLMSLTMCPWFNYAQMHMEWCSKFVSRIYPIYSELL